MCLYSTLVSMPGGGREYVGNNGSYEEIVNPYPDIVLSLNEESPEVQRKTRVRCWKVQLQT